MIRIKQRGLHQCRSCQPWMGAVAAALFLAAAWAGPAFGQASPESAKETLASVMVTANKQAENLQEVPMSMTVLDGLAIEDRQIKNMNELGDFVPNLMIFNDGIIGINSPSMRGIHADAESLGISTGLFIDGIPVSTTVGFADPLLDIEQVEILRGPRGTLYGKNTEVGVLRIISQTRSHVRCGKVLGCGPLSEGK